MRIAHKANRGLRVFRSISTLGLVVLAGCVTEKAGPSGATSPRAGTSPAPLPDGAIASPAIRASKAIARVKVAVKPLGTVPYDGQILPLISPDGRYLATHVGEAPPWEALLGQPLIAGQSLATRIEIYDLSTAPASLVASVDTSEIGASGAMLARGVDDQGFLIESTDAGGLWRLGRASWTSGTVRWLPVAAPGRASTQACLSSRGDLLYSEATESGQRSLVCVDANGTRSVVTEPGVSLLHPMATSDPGVVYAIAQRVTGETIGAASPGSLELVAYRMRESATISGARTLGVAIARRRLAATADLIVAYQAVAAGSIALPWRMEGQVVPAGTEPSPRLEIRDPLVFFSPGIQRAAVFDPSAGAILPLTPGTFSATRWQSGESVGYLASTQDGVVFDPLNTRAATQPDTRATARVVAIPAVARLTHHPETPVFLLGPVPGDPVRLAVTAMAAAVED